MKLDDAIIINSMNYGRSTRENSWVLIKYNWSLQRSVRKICKVQTFVMIRPRGDRDRCIRGFLGYTYSFTEPADDDWEQFPVHNHELE